MANQYDPELDKIVQTFLEKQLTPKRGLRVVARQYNGGAIKIACEEVFERRGELMSTTIKRIPLDLLADVAKAFTDASKVRWPSAAPKSEPPPASRPASAPAPKRSIWSAP